MTKWFCLGRRSWVIFLLFTFFFMNCSYDLHFSHYFHTLQNVTAKVGNKGDYQVGTLIQQRKVEYQKGI